MDTSILPSTGLEHGPPSGHEAGSRLASVTGAFVGASSTDYNKLALRYGTGVGSGDGGDGGTSNKWDLGVGSVGSFSATGASLSVAAGRLAFTFDLRGPVMTIDTGENYRHG